MPLSPSISSVLWAPHADWTTIQPDLGWHPLFIVAAFGVAVLALGAFFQLIQLFQSIRERAQTRDTTGDPWNGRTLEWSVPSPAPFYNFARTPHVKSRDAFWEMKNGNAREDDNAPYEDIYLPRNTGMGLYIAVAALIFGFSMVWHITWLAILAPLAIVTLLIVHSLNEETEYLVPAAEVARLDAAAHASL